MRKFRRNEELNGGKRLEMSIFAGKENDYEKKRDYYRIIRRGRYSIYPNKYVNTLPTILRKV